MGKINEKALQELTETIDNDEIWPKSLKDNYNNAFKKYPSNIEERDVIKLVEEIIRDSNNSNITEKARRVIQ